MAIGENGMTASPDSLTEYPLDKDGFSVFRFKNIDSLMPFFAVESKINF